MTVSRLALAVDQNELALPEAGRIAVLRARPENNYAVLPASRTLGLNSFRPDHDALLTQGWQMADALEGEFSAVLVEITRSKAETLGLIAAALIATIPDGLVMVDGAKTDGIDSVMKHCRALGLLEGSLSKAHGRLFWMKRPATLPLRLQAWAKDAAEGRNRDGFLTAPGMFSPDKIDPGSALLAEHFDNRLSGRTADLGAGWGWLSAQALAKGEISHIDLYEAEKTALDAAAKNLPDEKAGFHWVDVAQMGPPESRYDQVISNPPFHQGRAAEPALGIAFITAAADLLQPKGQFWLVANRQLPYEATLDLCFGHVKSLQETPHFKVFLASKPRAPAARKPRQDRGKSR